MTRKHTVLLADYVRTHNVTVALHCPSLKPFEFEHLATICAFFESVNPLFNRAQWLAYVGAISAIPQYQEASKS